jgi:hypothetical protein
VQDERIQYRLWRLGERFKQKCVAIKRYSNACRLRSAKSFGRTHSRFRQPDAGCGEPGGIVAFVGIEVRDSGLESPWSR